MENLLCQSDCNSLDVFSGCVTIVNILGCFNSRDWAALVSWHVWAGEMGAGQMGAGSAGEAEGISVVCWWLFIESSGVVLVQHGFFRL